MINQFPNSPLFEPIKGGLRAGLVTLAFLMPHSAWADIQASQPLQRYQTELRPKESLKSCLQRLHIQDPEIYKAIQSESIASEISHLPVGTPITLKADAAGKVQTLRIPLQPKLATENGGSTPTEVTVLSFVRSAEKSKPIQVQHTQEKTQIRIISKSGPFDGNFFNVMDRNEIPDAVSEQLIRVFSSSVDFPKDLVRGSFSMKYEVAYIDDSPVASGTLLYGAINTTRNQFQAFWWKAEDGPSNYYTLSGELQSAKSWKTPLLYSRKTSNFGMRIDPFTGDWANHQGIDIGAPMGTEVRATQSGKVKLFGEQGNYGNVVIIDHANGYQTIYGHLSGFAKLKPNQWIAQGALLGFVGSTGRSTGPHLHYELRKNGEAINPEQNFRTNTQNQQLKGEELKQFVKFQNSLLSSKLASR